MSFFYEQSFLHNNKVQNEQQNSPQTIKFKGFKVHNEEKRYFLFLIKI